MKLTYKQARTYLEYGHQFWVKDRSGDYCLFCGVDGDYIYSIYWSPEMTPNYSGTIQWGETDDLSHLQFIKFVSRKQIPVGTKVKILDSIKETRDWRVVRDYFPDMVGEVMEIHNTRNGLFYIVEGKDFRSIGAEYLVPLEEEYCDKCGNKLNKE